MIPPKTAIYITLNAARVLSLIALCLTFSSTILVMVDDIKAVNQLAATNSQQSASGNTTDTSSMLDCGYVAYV